MEAFNRALSEGKARVSRMQLAVIGDVGAGKTSLVRTLSGEEFSEEREETHGINTSMVEMTELDSSWDPVDLNKSHVDDILADIVSDDIRSSQVLHDNTSSERKALSQEITTYSPQGTLPAVPSYEEAKNMNPFIFETPHADAVVRNTDGATSECTSIVPVSRAKGEEKRLERQMPVGKIVESLSREPSNEKETKLYAKISIWDFAGHPLYETMHHIFLNRRSFYLVVFSLVKFMEDESGTLETLRFWLNSVRVHTPRSTPMFLVGTHCKQVQDDDISKAERVTYENFVESFGQQLVSSKEHSFLFAVENSLGSEDKGAVALKKMIEKEAHRLEHVEEELPIQWLHFEEEILQLQVATESPRCVSKEELRDRIHSKCGSMGEKEFESMIQFFHDSGVIILPGKVVS